MVRGLIVQRAVTACHDLSDGGLAVAVAEMALAGDMGATVAQPAGGAEGELPLHAWLFGEDQARYLVTAPAGGESLGVVLEAARQAGVPAVCIGETGGSGLTLAAAATISLRSLRAAHEDWMPGYMSA